MEIKKKEEMDGENGRSAGFCCSTHQHCCYGGCWVVTLLNFFSDFAHTVTKFGSAEFAAPFFWREGTLHWLVRQAENMQLNFWMCHLEIMLRHHWYKLCKFPSSYGKHWTALWLLGSWHCSAWTQYAFQLDVSRRQLFCHPLCWRA